MSLAGCLNGLVIGHLGMGLLPDYRGRGIGLRLLQATIDAARAAGFERIELSVYGRNARAAALYRKAGFAHEGTRVRGKKVDGEYDDVHIMGLILGEADGPPQGRTSPGAR